MRQVRSITATLTTLGVLLTAGSAAAAQGSAQKLPDPSKQGITTGVTPVRELPNLRTANSDTFLQSDGSRLLQIAAHQINYQHNGAWQPIETNLVPGAGGSWEPAASPMPVSLPVGLAGKAVKIGPAGRQLSLALQGAEGASGVSTGNERSYLAALKDVNVGFATTPRSVRETLTLASAAAPSEYRYSLALDAGMHATLNPGGSVTVRDSEGQIAYSIAAPTINDSSGKRHLPSTAPVHYQLNAAGTLLTLVVDRAWLAAPSRVFPVKIDPDVYFGALKDCTITSNSYENTELCGDPLWVGHSSEANFTDRALLQYDLSSVPLGSKILSSSIAMWLRSATPSTPVQIDAYGIDKHEFTSSTTWNRYDGTHAWTTAGGDHLKTLAGSTLVKPEYEGGWVSIGFSPQVEQWVRDPSSNFGILLKAHDETVNATDEFMQTDNGESEPEPDIHIVYEPQMGNPPNEAMFEEPIGNNDTLGVNVANGNLHITAPDVNYATEGYETQLARYYNSADDEHVTESIGNGWGLNMGEDTLLYPAWWDGSNVFHEPDGSYTRFDRAAWADNHPAYGDEAYTGDAYRPETLLKHENDTRTLTYNDTGVKWQFDNSGNGFPQKIEDPSGEGDTISLTYTGSRITKVTDTHSHELNLTRDPTTHRVSKIKGAGSGEEWKYTYSAGNLTEYKGPGGQEAKYTNTGPYSEISAITDPSGTTVISYDEDNRVTSLRHVVNGTVTTVGSEDETTTFSYETEQTTVTHADATSSVYYYDQFGNRREEPAEQEEAAKFYAGYAEIEEAAAHKDVDLQDHAAILDSQLSAALGNGYTGEWFNPGTKKIEIGVTSEEYEPTVTQDLDNLGLRDNSTIVQEAHSIPQLEEGENALSEALASLQNEGLIAIGVEPELNKVVIEEGTSLTKGEKEEVEGATAGVAVPVQIMLLTTSTAALPEMGCQRGSCPAPLRGGTRISSTHRECTAGFNALSRHGNPKKHYVITAGHCLAPEGLGGGWAAHFAGGKESEEEVLHPPTTEFGQTTAYVWGEEHKGVTTTSKGDMGIIEETPLGQVLWGSEPRIVTWARSELEPFGVLRNEHYLLFGTGYSETSGSKGFVVCTSGVGEVGGPHEVSACGKEKGLRDEGRAHNLELVDVCGLTHHTTQLSHGASGSPVYKLGVAYGVLIGLDECRFSYEGINRIQEALHAYVWTARP
jgi:hypothetical protein